MKSKIICKIYKNNPMKALEIIENINHYHKTILRVLLVTNNADLKNSIYCIIIKKLTTDIKNYKDGKKITTLAKWLPRENSHFDRRLNFVNNMIKRMYPELKSSEAKKIYRKTNTKLCNKLQVIEQKICLKKSNEINLDMVSVCSIRKNIKQLTKTLKLKRKLISFFTKRFHAMSDKNYINYLIRTDITSIETNCLVNLFFVKESKIKCESDKWEKCKNPCVIINIPWKPSELNYKNILLALVALKEGGSILTDNGFFTIEKNNIFALTKKIISLTPGYTKSIDLNEISKITSKPLVILTDKVYYGNCKNNIIFNSAKKLFSVYQHLLYSCRYILNLIYGNKS